MGLGRDTLPKIRASGNASDSLPLRKHPALDDRDIRRQTQHDPSKATYSILMLIGDDHNF
jgi:hypothetical protein